VTKHLAKHFVASRDIRLAPHDVTELRLNHHHGRFDVGSLVVMGKELLPLELEVMERLAEQSTDAAGRIGLEHDVRRGPDLGDGLMRTRPEIIVRQIVHKLGFRFRLHRRDLPGTPDLVFTRLHRIVFVHGCFWHMHRCPKGKSKPVSNGRFWRSKLEGNAARDNRTIAKLRYLGWHVLTVWECEVRNPKKLARRLAKFLSA
jgi:DNA mismatch endonuclease (patch repair protein)